jgi:hypothetical protein
LDRLEPGKEQGIARNSSRYIATDNQKQTGAQEDAAPQISGFDVQSSLNPPLHPKNLLSQ